MDRMFLGLAAAAVALVAAAPAAAVTLSDLSGSVHAGVDLTLDGVFDHQTDQHSWTGSPTSISASASSALTGQNGGVANAAAAYSGDWGASGLTGTGSMSDSFSITPDPDGIDNGIFYDQPGWTYTFTPDANATFTLTFDTSGSGTSRVEQGYTVSVDGQDHHLGDYIFFPSPNDSGVLAFNLLGGHSHTLQIFTQSNGGTSFGASGNEEGGFSFAITDGPARISGAPEPGAWALMLGGFGLAGASLRKRRAAIA